MSQPVTASVVMATFNKATSLRRTLNSIVLQIPTFPFEVIVVDDGSTDDTRAVCGAFPVRYHYLDRPGYRNPGPARNVGYRLATGDVVISQSDDVEHKTEDAIAKLVNYLTPTTCVVANVRNIRADGRRISAYTSPRMRRPYFFLGSVWRRDLYAVGGNDEDFIYPGWEDRWLGLCLEQLPREFVYVSDVIGWHHDHPRPTFPNSNTWKLLRNKTLLARRGRHPWTARSGAWPWPEGRAEDRQP
jgi:glycosyltransferase involved in cell wall biosynthesis